MALTHNQINKLWFNPSYDKFKIHGFVKNIFTSKDAEDFIRTGAYLIKEAEKHSNIIIPWDENRRYEILANPRLENAFVSLGAEYLLKGTFLLKGYAVNKPLPSSTGLPHPIILSGNKSKLRANEVQDLSYIIDHIAKIIDFTEFNTLQKEAETKAKNDLKGQRLRGITRMTIPFPNAQELLGYIHFKRNYALHRPFTIPEFRGITQHIFKLLDYIAQKGSSRSIEVLAKLND
ncbi:hypothetical protein A2W32_01890 [candidate division WWE3 bacterium RBG_16_37_10]|uniref:Uncharacterized protein n=2 Tax=Bacteria candidate phyla TaxID=1783234 RepID=A0A1F4UXR7_UNCKA|nr:MAG: hypothetical protein A2W32_01890 [candidate division WWE3 bacterium RBG_16_37_10]OGM98372.1 MAG: hypothetical protein A2735_00880 [Candidatus Yanofskybacteria bacterium RIFCSPHIGHO2_01_FULL_41_21]